MNEWIDTISEWTGIKTAALGPVLVFALVVVVVVVGFVAFGIVLIVRSNRGRPPEQTPPERPTESPRNPSRR